MRENARYGEQGKRKACPLLLPGVIGLCGSSCVSWTWGWRLAFGPTPETEQLRPRSQHCQGGLRAPPN